MKKRIGEVWVDSGQVMIVDPSYLGNWKDTEFDGTTDENDDSFSYEGACNVTLSKIAGQLQHGAVVSSSGYGDGCYPVFATFNDEGRVTRLEIDFVLDEEQ